eukprot:6199679-Pleurochrysis_carterae.AAC.2
MGHWQPQGRLCLSLCGRLRAACLTHVPSFPSVCLDTRGSSKDCGNSGSERYVRFSLSCSQSVAVRDAPDQLSCDSRSLN